MNWMDSISVVQAKHLSSAWNPPGKQPKFSYQKAGRNDEIGVATSNNSRVNVQNPWKIVFFQKKK